MRLSLSSALLTLAWFSVVNAAASSLVWLAVRRRLAAGGRPGAGTLFALRMAPLAASILFTLGIFLPVHWAYEPRDGAESFGALVWGLALFAAVLIGGRARRVYVALQACRRLRSTWRDQIRGTRLVVDDSALPGMSLAGILRTTIVVGRPVREALTHEELEVALAHENAHRQSWDNLKRFAIFASPDLFGFTAAARHLEQRWSAEVECQADAAAAAGDASRAANLASALVKVARLAGAASRMPATPLWSTFYEKPLLELRVRRLVDGTAVSPPGSGLPLPGLLALGTLTVCGVWVADLPRQLHVMTEALVRLLP
jgi:hypothetical protein